MDPVEAAALQDQVETPDVFVVKDRQGFWTYFSRLEDGRWLVEYDPLIEYRGHRVAIVGPWGVREFLPLEADLSLIAPLVSMAWADRT